MELKIGQQFKVVEVLTYIGYASDVFKVGGWTLHFKEYSDNSGFTLLNRFKPRTGKLFMKEYGCSVGFMGGREVKLVGRLTVTKVK